MSETPQPEPAYLGRALRIGPGGERRDRRGWCRHRGRRSNDHSRHFPGHRRRDAGRARRQTAREAEAKKASRPSPLIVATDKGEAGDVADSLTKLGGTVSQRQDRVGFVLAKVPTDRVLKAATPARRLGGRPGRGHPTAGPDPGTDPHRHRRRAAGHRRGAGRGHPGRQPVHTRPTRPARSTFVKAHPKWDGRGVTIGIMDSGVDLAHPALQTDHHRRAQDRRLGHRDRPAATATARWRRMTDRGHRPDLHHRRPAPGPRPAGTYRFNLFSESITAGGDARR